ncbi:DHA2 family efflux MFS transporter permease subunit [Pigmentibacter sp. JX0631]|uniref:DHA2 family efflux MFS transporter permease subunit n=1 Tax=Pigmentibacter sp. JX0631 TaxID=2976982 RepID=UPI002468677B|nr:DHA2 family efflux MFS transporter permease subunit [Pigmentibacter sp. JX0631]WGL59401.1 DHA2 family efflux MFS transporter permease subunit [Pigmentibacter sp. JX0631]
MNANSKLIIFVAVMASLLEIIDTSIVNVAIPTMMGNLGATLEDVSMVITGYTVANAIVLPISAWFGERFGRRQYYLSCIFIFTVTSVACGLAPNLTSLIIFRILQGIAGGALLPTSQALIYEQFPPEKAGIAGAIFGMSVMIGPTLGPVMGGYLTDNYGWRSIFNINLPLGLLTLAVGYTCIKNRENHGSNKVRLDILGFILLVLGIGCLQFMLERGQADEWFDSKLILACAIISLVSIISFIFWEFKVKNPLLNLHLFKEPIVVSGITLMACLGFYLFGIVFILPVFLNRAYNYDAVQIGAMFIPGSILTAFCMPFIGKQIQKTADPRRLIFIGLVLVELSLVMMTFFSSFTSKDYVLYMLFVRGVALAYLFVPINSTILSQFSGYELGQVSGFLNLFRQIGGSMGIAFIDTMLARKLSSNYNELLPSLSSLNINAANELNGNIHGLATKFPNQVGFTDYMTASVASIYHRVQQQIFMLSFLQLVGIMMVIFSISFIPLFLIKLKKKVVAVTDAH